MPILGIIASQNYPRITSSYESIASATGTGSSGTITFSTVPSGFKHLQIRGIGRSTRANVNSNMYVGFNGDTTTANYYGHYLNGDGSSAGAGAKIGTQTINAAWLTGSTAAADTYTAFVIDILDYGSTTKNKTLRSLQGYDLNGSGVIVLNSGVWFNSSTAISSIEITDPLGNFTSLTKIALYGVKG